MTKFIIIFLILFLPVVELIAEEPIFRNFNVEKVNQQYVIVKPKNYQNFLEAKQIDTLFYIGLKFFDMYEEMSAKSKLYRNWKQEMAEKTAPKEVRTKVQQIMNNDTFCMSGKDVDHSLYVNLLIDRTGNILNVFFKTSANTLAGLTEKEIQQTADAFMEAKIDTAIMNLTNVEIYYNEEQFMKMCKYACTHQVELQKKNLFRPLKVFNLLGWTPIQLDYGLLELQIGDPRIAYQYRENQKKTSSEREDQL